MEFKHQMLYSQSFNTTLRATSRIQWSLQQAIATGSDRAKKSQQAGCTEVDQWIGFSTITLPTDGLKFSHFLLNQPNFDQSMAGLKLWLVGGRDGDCGGVISHKNLTRQPTKIHLQYTWIISFWMDWTLSCFLGRGKVVYYSSLYIPSPHKIKV